MQIEDPNDPQGQETPPEPQPAPEPEPVQPQIDLDQAYEVIAQREGWDPRLTRYEIQEHKRRVQEFEREKKQWEQERQRRYEPQEDTSDPYMREIRDTRRIVLDFIEGQKREREQQGIINRVATELQSSYVAMARQAGLTKEQMDSAADEFYATVTDMYPEAEMIQKVGAERAARNAFRNINGNGAGRMPSRPQVSGRGPTATRTIPGSPQPYMPHGNPLPPEENLSAEQLPGETDEQYRERLQRIIEGAGIRRLPDGTSVRSR